MSAEHKTQNQMTIPTQPTSLICRAAFNCKELMEKYPPLYANRNKKAVFETIVPNGPNDCNGTLIYANYDLIDLPNIIPNPTHFIENQLKIDKTIYEYICNTNNSKERHFYVNFSDSNLFAFYQGSLFAQDELMTLEQPILCSLREKLGAEYQNDKNELTPFCLGSVIILNSIKHGHFTQKSLNNVYGRKFKNTSIAKIKKSVNIEKPPKYVNIICMAAIRGRKKQKYTEKQIDILIKRAYCGFNGAVTEINVSKNDNDEKNDENIRKKIIIHTGNWGCGAFGGNIELHTILQIVAAVASGVDMMYYHGVTKKEMKKAQNGCKILLKEIYPKCKDQNGNIKTDLFIIELLKKCYLWGTSNGT